MRAIPPGWYVLLYHEVSWAEPPHLHGMGLTCPPDRFHDHVEALCRAGDVVSLEEGARRAEGGGLATPLFTLTFDDGFRGVFDHAFPVLRSHDVAATVAVCSRFVDRDDVLWRSKLAFLRHAHAIAALRDRLEPLGLERGAPVKDFTLDHFGPDVVGAVDGLYREVADDRDHRRGLALGMEPAHLEELTDHGWTVANHSAAHHPVGEPSTVDGFEQEFVECEDRLVELLGRPTDFWVLPFDRPYRRSPDLFERFAAVAGSRDLVLVGEQPTRASDVDAHTIFRITAPYGPAAALLRHVRRCAARSLPARGRMPGRRRRTDARS